MRRTLPFLLILVAFTSACSKSKGAGPSDTPAASPSAPSPSAPSNNASVTGRVVTNPGGHGIAGATIELQGTTVTTDGEGNFSVLPSNQDRKARVAAAGYLGRETWLRSGSRSNVTIDLIVNAAPFSLDFYRTIARGAGSTSLQPLRRWDENPNFYIKTTDQAGREVAVASVDIVERTIRESIPQITGGSLDVGRIERGSNARPMTKGWINVDLTTDLNYNLCGEALVGANPGRLLVNASSRNKCGTEMPSPACVAHELGHAMGLWHTPAPSTMQPTPGLGGAPCNTGDFTAKEQYHTAILYSRPRDNMDTDIDPGAFQLMTPQGASEQSLESCPLR